MVKSKRVQTEDEPEQEFHVVPGPAEEAEGTIHPAEDPVEELPQPEPVQETGLDDIVGQVLAGEWGVGQDRRLRLARAGHNPNDIQKELVRRANNK